MALAFMSVANDVSAQGFGRRQPVEDPTGYKDTYKDYFTVGVAVNMRNVSNPDQIALIKKNFNSITAENDMKPVSLQPEEGKFNWENADKITPLCEALEKVQISGSGSVALEGNLPENGVQIQAGNKISAILSMVFPITLLISSVVITRSLSYS